MANKSFFTRLFPLDLFYFIHGKISFGFHTKGTEKAPPGSKPNGTFGCYAG